MSPDAPGAVARTDAYIASAPEDMRDALWRLRDVVRQSAPEAVESLSYGMVGFKYHGKPLVYLGYAKQHYALYGNTAAMLSALGDETEGLDVDKGTVRFSPARPLPEDLIHRIVRIRMAEVDAAPVKKPARKKGSSNARS